MRTEINQKKLKKLIQKEEKIFLLKHKKSGEMFNEAGKYLLGGVPMNWMVRWAGKHPIFVKSANGSHFFDVDGNKFIDLCLGDTGAMTGHTPAESIKTINQQIKKGITFMLPTENSILVGKELKERFGLPFWQFTLTATDANRFALRICRAITNRKKILVFNYCYHGSVDETFITLQNGKAKKRIGNLGPQVDPEHTTKVVEFNDVVALENALKQKDVACVLCEPAMTNVGIIHPEKNYHKHLRRLTKKYGTLLIIDETHTICTSAGGYTKAFNLKPDIITLGKPIAGGLPAAIFGLSTKVAKKFFRAVPKSTCDTSGIGGTLAGNALSVAVMRSVLNKILTEKNYKKTINLAKYFTNGVEKTIKEFKLPWIVNRLGCRAEYWFTQRKPRNGGEAVANYNSDLDYYMHLSTLNRGILMTPFHNMALIAPSTSKQDIDKHTKIFREIVNNLIN